MNKARRRVYKGQAKRKKKAMLYIEVHSIVIDNACRYWAGEDDGSTRLPRFICTFILRGRPLPSPSSWV